MNTGIYPAATSSMESSTTKVDRVSRNVYSAATSERQTQLLRLSLIPRFFLFGARAISWPCSLCFFCDQLGFGLETELTSVEIFQLLS